MKQVNVGKHIIRMAEMTDVPFIMDFFDRYWEKGCLLSRDRAYFEYEFVVDGRVNFVVAEHNETGTIDAACGFIQCTKGKLRDAFGGMWVCKPKPGTKFLGLVLSENLAAVSGLRRSVGLGTEDSLGIRIAKDIYLSDVYKLDHYYRLAKRGACSDFKIAKIVKLSQMPTSVSSKKLIPIPTMQHLKSWFDFSIMPDVVMCKDAWYVEHRYFNHPYYKFNVWGIEESPGNIIGFLVCRIVHCNESACLRIVDFFGPDNALDGIGGELDLIMASENIEYTDFYCAGIPRKNVLNAGFVLRDDDDTNVIPNHFEPYEQKNVDLFSIGRGPRVFKGDADQGRPKLLRPPSKWHSDTTSHFLAK